MLQIWGCCESWGWHRRSCWAVSFRRWAGAGDVDRSLEDWNICFNARKVFWHERGSCFHMLPEIKHKLSIDTWQECKQIILIHAVHRVLQNQAKTPSEEEQKKEVPEEWHKKAQQMADEAYAHRLKELQMSGHDEQESLGSTRFRKRKVKETKLGIYVLYIYIYSVWGIWRHESGIR